jgi:hypothetical protein
VVERRLQRRREVVVEPGRRCLGGGLAPMVTAVSMGQS